MLLFLRAAGLLLPLALLITGTAPVRAELTHAFPYQGALGDGGVPAQGSYSFEFALFDDPVAGAQVGPTLDFDDVPVINGVFSVGLDFGDGVFTGQRLWIETRAASSSTATPVVLTPRRELMATPYALYSLDAARVGGVEAAALTPQPIARLRTPYRVGYVNSRLTSPEPFLIDFAGSIDPAGEQLLHGIDPLGDASDPTGIDYDASLLASIHLRQPGSYSVRGWVRNIAATRYASATIPLEVRSGGGVAVADATAGGVDFVSLAEVAGHPAMAYYHIPTQSLKYVRALNPAGSLWGAPVTVHATGDVGQYASLAVAAGRPAIAYYNATTSRLIYVRALDSLGDAWGIPFTVDATTGVGKYASLATHPSMFPGIAYYDETNTNLKFALAEDFTGTLWGPPQTLDSSGSVGQHAALAAWPHGEGYRIAYADSNGDVRYTHSIAGTSWAEPVVLHSSGVLGAIGGISIGILDDHSIIAFQQQSTIRFLESRTEDLVTSWLPAFTISPNFSATPSVTTVGNSPAVAYRRSSELPYRFRLPGRDDEWTFSAASVANVATGSRPVSLAVVDGSPALGFAAPSSQGLRFAR